MQLLLTELDYLLVVQTNLLLGIMEIQDLTSQHDIHAAGNITLTGTVDGRDVAADGTKLDGIESSATADQSDAEIRAAVEAATDSNVFTDADHSKLNGIEASATADQTAAEIRSLVGTGNNNFVHQQVQQDTS